MREIFISLGDLIVSVAGDRFPCLKVPKMCALMMSEHAGCEKLSFELQQRLEVPGDSTLSLVRMESWMWYPFLSFLGGKIIWLSSSLRKTLITSEFLLVNFFCLRYFL